MQTKEIELSVGDAICIGDRILTLVDVDGDEAAFRINELPREISADSEDSLPRAK